MSDITTTLKTKGIRPTAMRSLVYQELAKQNTAVALTDIELAFTKADRTKNLGSSGDGVRSRSYRRMCFLSLR